MICEKCGKQLPEGVRFCDECGTKVVISETTPVQNSASAESFSAPNQNPAPASEYGYNPNPGYYTQPANTGDVVSAGGYIWRNILLGLVSCIPVVGIIVYIVLLCVWMGDKTKQESFRNWAKGSLIMIIIGFVLAIIFVLLFVSLFAFLGITATDVANEFMYY